MVASHNGGRSLDPRTEPVQRLATLAADGVTLARGPADTDPAFRHGVAVTLPQRRPNGTRDERPASVTMHPVPRGEPPAPSPHVAVLLPCRNEETTIADVVADFRRALPDAAIYVYDNASTDGTAAVARGAGATVAHVPHPGKGNVMRQMFADVDADVYVMADGDGTYDAAAAPSLIAALRERNLDMVVGRRVDRAEPGAAYRRGHRLGNQAFTGAVRWIFGKGPEDMLSGYRAFSRRYVRSFPASSRGFEIETEMTVHALDLGVPFAEMPTRYRARPPASVSKLRTIPDGLRILRCILMLCKEYRPARFFGAIVAALAVFAASAGMLRPWDTVGTVGTGRQVFFVCAVIAFGLTNVGLVLDSVSRNQREMKRVLYLAASDRSPITPKRPA
jgi:hypothetical protein